MYKINKKESIFFFSNVISQSNDKKEGYNSYTNRAENSSPSGSHTFKLRLTPTEEERLNQLAEQTHSSKAAILKQSLYRDESISSVAMMQMVLDASIKIKQALDGNDLEEVKEKVEEEVTDLCLKLNFVRPKTKAVK